MTDKDGLELRIERLEGVLVILADWLLAKSKRSHFVGGEPLRRPDDASILRAFIAEVSSDE